MMPASLYLQSAPFPAGITDPGDKNPRCKSARFVYELSFNNFGYVRIKACH
jgi:hypothetical protein